MSFGGRSIPLFYELLQKSFSCFRRFIRDKDEDLILMRPCVPVSVYVSVSVDWYSAQGDPVALLHQNASDETPWLLHKEYSNLLQSFLNNCCMPRRMYQIRSVSNARSSHDTQGIYLVQTNCGGFCKPNSLYTFS